MDAKLKRNAVEDLEKVLKQEIDLYREYAGTLTRDAELMNKLNIEELEKSNKTKNTLLLKIKALDQARQNLVRQMASAHSIPEEHTRLVDLCEKLTKEEAKRLLALRDELQGLIQELQNAHLHTTALATASLNWVNSSMATLHRLLSPTGVYNPQGKVERDSHFTGRVVEKQV